MYEHHSHLDFAALAQMPAEEALRLVYEHCAVLEARNAELSAALEESRLILQSFVMEALQRDGKLLEKTLSLDMQLGDFLRSRLPSKSSAPYGKRADGAEPQHTSSDSPAAASAVQPQPEASESTPPTPAPVPKPTVPLPKSWLSKPKESSPSSAAAAGR